MDTFQNVYSSIPNNNPYLIYALSTLKYRVFLIKFFSYYVSLLQTLLMSVIINLLSICVKNSLLFAGLGVKWSDLQNNFSYPLCKKHSQTHHAYKWMIFTTSVLIANSRSVFMRILRFHFFSWIFYGHTFRRIMSYIIPCIKYSQNRPYG